MGLGEGYTAMGISNYLVDMVGNLHEKLTTYKIDMFKSRKMEQ